MRKSTQQQIWLGWEDVDLTTKHFLCMCQVGNQKPICLSAHNALTYALIRNGNQARDWKADGGEAEEQTYGKAKWRLMVNGQLVRLFVDHIDRDAPSPMSVDYTRIEHKKGVRGRSAELLSAVNRK
jgi:hypothetical protein